MHCEIMWETSISKEWLARFETLPFTTLLQTPAYGLCMTEMQQQTPRFGTMTIDGKTAGLVHILEVGLLGNLIHAAILDRGPLWLDGFGNEEHFAAFCQALNAQFPRRFGRKRRFIPEIENSAEIQKILQNNGFKPTKSEKYQTLTLDITKTTDILRQNLSKSWKKSLKTAEKSKISIKWNKNLSYFNAFHDFYIKDKAEKNYDGPSSGLLKTMAQYFAPTGDFHIGQAIVGNKTIAAILLITHGKTATYQIGWSTQTGRKLCANHFLLWNSIDMLKEKGISTLDLGGVNDDTAKGIKKFKEGLGGKETLRHITLPGLYR